MAVSRDDPHTLAADFTQQLFIGRDGGIALVVGVHRYAGSQLPQRRTQCIEKFYGVGKSVGQQTNTGGLFRADRHGEVVGSLLNAHARIRVVIFNHGASSTE